MSEDSKPTAKPEGTPNNPTTTPPVERPTPPTLGPVHTHSRDVPMETTIKHPEPERREQ